MRTSLDLRDDVKLLTYIYHLSWNYTTKETAPQKGGIPTSLELMSCGKFLSQCPKARELMKIIIELCSPAEKFFSLLFER